MAYQNASCLSNVIAQSVFQPQKNANKADCELYVLREEIAVFLAKDAIEPVPLAEMRQDFYSPYFIVPKKGDGL